MGSIAKKIVDTERDDDLNIVSFIGYLVVLSLFYVIISYITNKYIVTDSVFIKTYSDQMSVNAIREFLEMRSAYSWFGYAIIPVTLIFKILFVSVSISIGFILMDMDKFNFRVILRPVIVAEFIFILYQTLYTINMGLNIESLTLDNAQVFYPFSLLSVLYDESMSFITQYILKTINIVEVFYALLISYLLSKRLNTDFRYSLKIVAASYLSGLTMWIVLLAFLTLQLS